MASRWKRLKSTVRRMFNMGTTEFWRMMSAGGSSHSGIAVNQKTALEYAPFFQGLRVISGDLAQMPLLLYRRTEGRNRVRAIEHPAYRLMKRKPHTLYTPLKFKETLQCHALSWGNGYAEIVRDNRMAPRALTILLPDRTEPKLVDNQLWYTTWANNQQYKIKAEDVLHIKGLGYDGLKGYSVVYLARHGIGLGLAAEKYAARFMRNNATPSGVLEYPGELEEEDGKRILRDWNAMHEGLDEVARTAILEDGMKFNPISMSNKDSQWLESRQFQKQDAASWLNLPPHKVGDLSRATFSNIEDQELSYLTGCLMYWLSGWQEECDEKLLTEEEKDAETHGFEFLTNARLRGNATARAAFYQSAIVNRWMSPNEVRALENMNSYEGGDKFENPNTTPGGPGSTPPKDDSPPSPEEDDDDTKTDEEEDEKPRKTATAQRLVASRLSELLAVEVNRIKTAAAKEKNLTDWVEKFYSANRWPKTVARAVLAVGGFESIAAEHCDRSRTDIMELLERVTPANLQIELASLLDKWASRPQELAEEILLSTSGKEAA